ncbi:unnamed protein product [Arabidopsis lyrata]|nr:unnamed protein product [Arabidopsis lyrata]
MTEKGLSDKTYTMESIEMEVTIMRHYKLKRLSIKNAKEGTESLGEKRTSPLTSKKVSTETVTCSPFSSTEENFRLKRFTTFDLLTEEMHLIMLKFIEVGQCVDPKEKQTAFEISQVICFISFASQHKLLLLVFYLVSCLYSFVKRYIDLMVSLNALSPKVPLYEITEGNEPCFFSTYFSWDSTKATKKAALLLGTHHFLEDQASSGNQGPRQRAAALAALTSGLNTSSGRTSSPKTIPFFVLHGEADTVTDPEISKAQYEKASTFWSLSFNGPQDQSSSGNQGPRQRAAAFAALTSPFNFSSGKTSSPLMPEEIGLVVNVDYFRIAEREAKYRSKSAQRKEGGLSSGYKNRMTEKGSSDGISCTYSSMRKILVHRHARSCYILWCHRTRAFAGEKKWKITEIKSGKWILRLEVCSQVLKFLVPGELMESRVAEVSADQRGRLAMSVKRLDQSKDRVREIRRLMLETEEVGISVFQDLNQQCQTLLHVHTKVVKIDGCVIGDGKVGRVTRTLQNAYKKRQRILVCQYLLTKNLEVQNESYSLDLDMCSHALVLYLSCAIFQDLNQQCQTLLHVHTKDRRNIGIVRLFGLPSELMSLGELVSIYSDLCRMGTPAAVINADELQVLFFHRSKNGSVEDLNILEMDAVDKLNTDQCSP